jgi:predicted dehydrogenase
MRFSFLTNFSVKSESRFYLHRKTLLSFCFLFIFIVGCQNTNKVKEEGNYPVRLMILDPGHFHAALLQKSMYDEISPVVHVYAPEGDDVKAYLGLVNGYNTRKEDPTKWDEKVYTGPDYLEKMLKDKPGNVVIIAGNNQKKTEYIKKSIDAGLNVLADKPMAIDSTGFKSLKEAFASAEKNKVLLFDIMTGRYEILNILEKELSQRPEVFGTLEKGTVENPAVRKDDVHYFYKTVSGSILIRPQWFYDVKQAGEGLVDITTHMVDMIQWTCFPGVGLDYNKDIQIVSAKRWSTPITPAQFKKSTNKDSFPSYLQKDIQNNVLNVYSNGEMNYTVKGVHAKVSIVWNFEGGEDSQYSIMRGTKANLIINKGKGYIEPVNNTDIKKYEETLKNSIAEINKTYPGVDVKKSEKGWELVIPKSYNIGHEAQFAEVAKKYMEYLKEGKMPDEEVSNMLAKYYTTTKALEKAQSKYIRDLPRRHRVL